jgi:hypothetical protein
MRTVITQRSAFLFKPISNLQRFRMEVPPARAARPSPRSGAAEPPDRGSGPALLHLDCRRAAALRLVLRQKSNLWKLHWVARTAAHRMTRVSPLLDRTVAHGGFVSVAPALTAVSADPAPGKGPLNAGLVCVSSGGGAGGCRRPPLRSDDECYADRYYPAVRISLQADLEPPAVSHGSSSCSNGEAVATVRGGRATGSRLWAGAAAV